MKRQIGYKYFFSGLTIAGVIGAVLSALANIPFWAAFALVAFSMFLNGLLAEYEDSLPGGFNNSMSPEEIALVKTEKRKKLLPWRIATWAVLNGIIVLIVWISKPDR